MTAQIQLAAPRCRLFVAFVLLATGAIWASHGLSDEGPQKAARQPAAPKTPRATHEPKYTKQGELELPDDFMSWVFVGSNLGVEYRADGDKNAPAEKNSDKQLKAANFHNVYINPEAYEHFASTGKFPDKTMLVLDVYKAEEGEPRSIVSEGLFPGKRKEIAMAVKNSARPDGSQTEWAYYDFGVDKKAAKAFPDKACYDCHIQHADVDNVWVQFYPTLRAKKSPGK